MNQCIDLSKLIAETSDVQKPFVIVGGGIAGIYAALLLQDVCPRQKVILIEQSAQLGGLLASKQFNGEWFDFGTHVPRQTGQPHIDALLFDDMESKGFSSFRNSNAANISRDNYLYTRSPNPFLATPQNQNINVQLDQIKASTSYVEHENLASQLIQLYGHSLTEEFFKPCMQKRFGMDLHELTPDSHRLIGLSRLVLGDAALMTELKQHPGYDSVLAFADQTEGMSELNHYYPTHGEGVGKWVASLVDKLDSTNVSIFCQAHVSGVTVNAGDIDSVTFIDNIDHQQRIDCAHLFWCGPVFPLLKLANCDYVPTYRPVIRKTYLYQFAFEDAPLIQSNYVNVYDATYSSFRVTLYSNLCKTTSDVHKLTVEVIADDSSENIPDVDDIHRELLDMRLIDKSNPLKFAIMDTVDAGFPVLTREFMQETKKQVDTACGYMNNLSLLGKANGQSFFMHDVLVNTHEQICALVK